MIDNPKTEVWYKKQRLGINSTDQMMKNIIKDTPLETSSKRLSNHSVRKMVVKKLRAANVERQSIIQVTGHVTKEVKESKLSGELHRQQHQPVSQDLPQEIRYIHFDSSETSSVHLLSGSHVTILSTRHLHVVR